MKRPTRLRGTKPKEGEDKSSIGVCWRIFGEILLKHGLRNWPSSKNSRHMGGTLNLPLFDSLSHSSLLHPSNQLPLDTGYTTYTLSHPPDLFFLCPCLSLHATKLHNHGGGWENEDKQFSSLHSKVGEWREMAKMEEWDGRLSHYGWSMAFCLRTLTFEQYRRRRVKLRLSSKTMQKVLLLWEMG